MKITLMTEDSIRLEPVPGQLTVEAPTAEQIYSPFHMLASGLAVCTFSILESWASNLKLDTSDLTIDVAWTFVEKPHRMGTIDLSFTWPSLPEARRVTAQRVAELCPIHKTLMIAPTINMRAVS